MCKESEFGKTANELEIPASDPTPIIDRTSKEGHVNPSSRHNVLDDATREAWRRDLRDYTLYASSGKVAKRQSFSLTQKKEPAIARAVEEAVLMQAQLCEFAGISPRKFGGKVPSHSLYISYGDAYIHVYDSNRSGPKERNHFLTQFGIKNNWGPAFTAAEEARELALTGDTSAVDSFVTSWIARSVSAETRDAVTAALLEDDWLSGPKTNSEFIASFRSRINESRRALRPLWRTKINYSEIGSLEGGENLGVLTPTDVANPEFRLFHPFVSPLYPEHAQEMLIPTFGEQAKRNILKLKTEERRTAFSWASDIWESKERGWEEAAKCAMQENPAAQGERVRRKMRRLGKEEERRRR